jgi:hypothetical protein
MRAATFWVVCAMTMLAASAGSAAEPEITNEIAMRAVVGFREANPMSDDALGYASIALRFVEKDPKLQFTLTSQNTSFLFAKKLSQRQRSVLLGAYTVGNLRSCLLRQDRIDDAYAGTLQVIDTYHRLQKAKPRFWVPEIEKLIEMEGRGELQKYVSAR